MERHFLYIYFRNGDMAKRKKRDVTIAFRADDELYVKCRKLTSSQIKQIIEVKTYEELMEEAGKEDRSINNFIKSRLRRKLLPNNE